MDSLLSNILSTSSVASSANAVQGWAIAGIIVGVLGAIGLWILFNFVIKGAEKRKPAEDAKKFFLLRGNFARDLAQFLLFYMSIKLVIATFGTMIAGGGDFWNLYLVPVIGGLVWYRFVYEVIIAVISLGNKEK